MSENAVGEIKRYIAVFAYESRCDEDWQNQIEPFVLGVIAVSLGLKQVDDLQEAELDQALEICHGVLETATRYKGMR